MGKSTHGSRKRRRSSSSKHRDRIEGLENKISQLIEVLSRREVRYTHVESLSPTVSSAAACHTDQESDRERISDDIIREDTSGRARSASQVAETASPASQVRPKDPQVTGVYVHPSSVTQTEESTQPFPINRNTFSSFVAVVSNLSDDGLPTSPQSKTIVLSEPAAAEDSADTLTKELFGAVCQTAETQPWNDLVVQQWRELVRNGLPSGQREALLKKYSPSEELAFLKAPKLNPECKSALKNNAIVKRDEYCCSNQDQVGSALFAFGEALSDLLRQESQSSLNAEARAAVGKLNEGVKIIADLFYRLSLSRRALVKPAFNILAKNTADAIPADNLLFGASFGEEIKKAAAMEKSSKDIVNASLTLSKKTQQPIKRPVQTAPVRSGNVRAPVSRSRPLATRRAGASSSSRQSSHRYRSRSRRR